MPVYPTGMDFSNGQLRILIHWAGNIAQGLFIASYAIPSLFASVSLQIWLKNVCSGILFLAFALFLENKRKDLS